MGKTLNIKKEVKEAVATMSIKVNLVECDCGEKLHFDIHLDNFNDLQISVAEHICTQKEED